MMNTEANRAREFARQKDQVTGCTVIKRNMFRPAGQALSQRHACLASQGTAGPRQL